MIYYTLFDHNKEVQSTYNAVIVAVGLLLSDRLLLMGSRLVVYLEC